MDLQNLKKKRATLKASTTKLITKIETNINSANIEDLEIYLEQLIEKNKSLKSLNIEIENLIESKDIEAEINGSEEYEETLISWKIKLTRKIKELNSKTNSITPSKSEVNESSEIENKTVKLPRLEIPKYYGNPAHFLEFYSQFENAIHKNNFISKLDKFNYLKSFLSGSAASAISGLTLSDENYDAAIDILKQRFGRKDILINTHISQLLDLKPVKNSSDLYSLRKLYERAEIQIRNLNSLGIESQSFSSLLCPILLKLLPPDLTLQFSRESTNENWELDKLLILIQKEISDRERSNSLYSDRDESRKYDSRNKTFNNRKPVTANRSEKQFFNQSFMATDERGAKNDCIFCKSKEHLSDYCKAISLDEKRNILRSQGRCFLCLLQNHKISQCKQKKVCETCKKTHNTTLCFRNNESVKIKNDTGIVTSISQSSSKNRVVYLQTCSARMGYVQNTEQLELARILLDTGSSRSYISTTVQNKFNFPVIRKEFLSVFSFGSETPYTKEFDVVIVNLQNRDDPSLNINVELLVTDQISAAKIPIPESIIFSSEKVLKNLQIADCSSNDSNDINILIGLDCYNEIVTGNIKRLNKKIVASETLFGWCLQGTDYVPSMHCVAMNIVIDENHISKQIEKFWQVESLGVESENQNSNSLENETLLEFENNIRYENKRYTVKFPWKPNVKELLFDNYDIALNRFNKLKLTFRNNPSLFFEYKSVIEDYLEQNIIEPVIQSESEQPIFYLPHRAVLRSDKLTSKLRIVFDASSHAQGKLSLNDCLDVGPNLYNDLFDVLLSFREFPVAFVSDIKQAFLQLELDHTDRDVTRFFWTDNPHSNEPPTEYRFTRVLFGINCSPFLLTATIKFHLQKISESYPNTTKLLEHCCYVDDVIAGDANVESAFSTSLECIKIFDEASMQLHKWQTNCKDLTKLWVKENVPVLDTTVGNTPIKVLGISWNTEEDNLYFDSKPLRAFLLKPINTKRFVLQTLGRLFDPIGFYGPYTVRLKILMQEIWSCKIDWDDELPENILKKWESWYLEVEDLDEVKIPRYYWHTTYFDSETAQMQLHCFSDASLRAYGSVIYLRSCSADGHIQTAFVAAKSKVAPLKSLSLPRLELLGALLSARLSSKVLKNLKYILSTFYWTDSTITYFWVTGSSDRFKPFVKHRIEEIQNLTKGAIWSHCPGINNPADLISRGMAVQDLKNSDIWKYGPAWLSEPPENWPKQKAVSVNEDDLETRKNVIIFECIVNNSELIDLEKYSSILKVFRIFAYVIRFINKIRKISVEREALTAAELKNAEQELVKNVQRNYYLVEINALQENKPIPPSSSLYNFAPFLDDQGVLRIKGRLKESEYTFEEKHPVIIPKDSTLSKLIVTQEHTNTFHGGVAITLAKVRERFWVPKGRQFVKKIIKRCLICQKYSAKPANQITGQLPSDRIKESPPFYVTGLDFIGPIYVKNFGETRKSYITIFTCAVTRALHLEFVSNMSTPTFLLAFRRFIARRENCRIIYSDNAKTFKKSKIELDHLSKILSDDKLHNFIAHKNITWKFIAERAAWWGGFYERLVKSVKECLRKILGKALLNFEEMSTVLTEVEAVLNHRPISYIYDELEEPQPLTPANFLNFAQDDQQLPFTISEILSGSTRLSLKRRKLYQNLLVRQLWNKWKKYYLLDLRSAHRLENPESQPNLKIGDVVLIEGDHKSKLMWKLGRITKEFVGRDGNVRSVELKTSNGTLKRSVQHLYPLELT